jgi:hypothetical protein
MLHVRRESSVVTVESAFEHRSLEGVDNVIMVEVEVEVEVEDRKVDINILPSPLALGSRRPCHRDRTSGSGRPCHRERTAGSLL